MYDVIMEKAVAVGIGMASSQRIDEINILQATYEAMREAISKLSVKPDILLMMRSRFPEFPSDRCQLSKEMQKVFPLGLQALWRRLPETV